MYPEMKILAGTALAVSALYMSGCGVVAASLAEQHTSSTHDFVMAGTREAMQDYYDAALASAKQMVEPHDRSLYTERRILQEQEYTIRNEDGKTFWQRITARAKALTGGIKKPAVKPAPSIEDIGGAS